MEGVGRAIMESERLTAVSRWTCYMGFILSSSVFLVVPIIFVSEEIYPLLSGCWMDSIIKLTLAGKKLSIGAGVGEEILDNGW